MAFPDNWERKCLLTINETYIDDNLTDWTLILTEAILPSEMLNSDDPNSEADGGGAIRITTDVDGANRLPVHVRCFTPTPSGIGAYADIAVKVPNVSSSANTNLCIWYKKAGEVQPVASDTYGQYNAYDSNYLAVYSLNQDPGPGGANEILDATSNQLHLTAEASMTSGDLVFAKAFKGINFDSVDDYLSRGGLTISPPLTLEGLCNFLSLYDPQGVMISLYTATEEQALLVANLPSGVARMAWSNLPNVGWDGPQTAISQIGWHHVAGTMSGTSALKVYLNGTNESVGVASGVGFGSDVYNTLNLGRIGDYTSGVYLRGILDEIRISSVARSAAWIKADSNNLINPALFVSVGTPIGPVTLVPGVVTDITDIVGASFGF